NFRLKAVETFVLRAPVETPVQTSFGIMRERPALLVRIQDEDGLSGWGEVWCNFPSVGAEHRARLIHTYIKPLLLERDWVSARRCFDFLTSKLEILAIQSGEHGPLAQVVAGLD